MVRDRRISVLWTLAWVFLTLSSALRHVRVLWPILLWLRLPVPEEGRDGVDGTGKIVVELFSTEISPKVWRYLN